MNDPGELQGLVPDRLRIRQSKILLDRLAVDVDIGFHDFEIGHPQRLLVSIELWLDPAELPSDDEPLSAWNYDHLRNEVRRLAASRRFNLQETFLRALYDRLASLRGVQDLRVQSTKPDVYEDAHGVGVEIASLRTNSPQR